IRRERRRQRTYQNDLAARRDIFLDLDFSRVCVGAPGDWQYLRPAVFVGTGVGDAGDEADAEKCSSGRTGSGESESCRRSDAGIDEEVAAQFFAAAPERGNRCPRIAPD